MITARKIDSLGRQTWRTVLILGEPVARGLLHRTDGPAVIWPTGHKEWWISGKRYYTKAEFFEALTKKQKENLLYNSEFMK